MAPRRVSRATARSTSSAWTGDTWTSVSAVGRTIYGERLNLCIWNKSNAGMGSLYRSKHELVFVYRVGTAPHLNTVELGKHGRNRTNVWDYASVNSMRGSRREDLALHPTVKPTGLVADAIQDVTRRGDLVLDLFLGSGTTLMAAERTGRRFRGLDIDPAYVDVAIERWSARTGLEPRLEGAGVVNKKSRSGSAPNPGWFPKGRSGNPEGPPESLAALHRLRVRGLGGKDPHRGGPRRHARDHDGGSAAAADLSGCPGRQAHGHARGREMDHEARGLAGEACAKSIPAGRSRVTSRPIPTTRMPLLCFSGSRRQSARARHWRDRAQLLLEPWAVQAALRRRRGGQRLTDRGA